MGVWSGGRWGGGLFGGGVGARGLDAAGLCAPRPVGGRGGVRGLRGTRAFTAGGGGGGLSPPRPRRPGPRARGRRDRWADVEESADSVEHAHLRRVAEAGISSLSPGAIRLAEKERGGAGASCGDPALAREFW